MNGLHPLNLAVISQALHDLRNGQLRRCLSMGFAQQDLEALKQPELVSMLANAAVSWCTVTVNRDVLQRLLQQVHDNGQEVALIDRVLKLCGSTEMVSQFFGLTHQEVALRREMLGLPKRKGRHPILTEEQEIALWNRWKPELQSRGITVDEQHAMLLLAMDMAEAEAHPLSVVWAAIQSWIDQGLTSQ
jgi:hypothetical protein